MSDISEFLVLFFNFAFFGFFSDFLGDFYTGLYFSLLYFCYLWKLLIDFNKSFLAAFCKESKFLNRSISVLSAFCWTFLSYSSSSVSGFFLASSSFLSLFYSLFRIAVVLSKELVKRFSCS